MKFEKPALTIEEQLTQLQERGLIIKDFDLAKHYLKYISYYRLRAYWLSFELGETNANPHRFKEGTTLQHIIDLYVFDREVRLLLIDAIERIEVAVRSVWAYHMATKYGSHGYLASNLYKDFDRFITTYSLLQKEQGRSKETFIHHYKKNYCSPRLPPIWMSSEILSFGQLSKWINNLKSPEDRNAIARVFSLDEKIFCPFMHHIAHIRNICAHHGRLWDKEIVMRMKLPQRPSLLRKTLNKEKPHNIFNTLCVIKFILSTISPTSEWGLKVSTLINSYSVDLAAMGFPRDWESRPLWKGTYQPF